MNHNVSQPNVSAIGWVVWRTPTSKVSCAAPRIRGCGQRRCCLDVCVSLCYLAALRHASHVDAAGKSRQTGK